MSVTIDFDVAKTSHLTWMTKLRDFLDGKEVLTEQEAVSGHDCYLGKWLYGEALTKYNGVPEMHQLEKEHMILHETMKKVITQKNSGNAELANQTLASMSDMSKGIVSLLTTVQVKLSLD